MEVDDTKERLLRRFLLGDITETERAILEDRFLGSEHEFDALEMVEDELIEDYLRSRLPADERKRFEASYLTTAAGRERVASARTLFTELASRKRLAIDTPAPSHEVGLLSSWKFLWRPAFAVIGVFILAVLGFFAFMRQGTEPPEIAANVPVPEASTNPKTPVTKEEPGRSNTTADPQVTPVPAPTPSVSPTPGRQKPSAATPTLATFVLRPGAARGGAGGNGITVPPGATEIGFRLVLETNEFPTYTARVTTIEGGTVYTSSRLKPNRSGIFLKIPVRSLERNDYIVELTGVDAKRRSTRVNDYTFSVLK